ncbi:phosphoglycerate mutase-like protein 4 [Panicum miliaceum]|uniref:Phosphoglycerate mutase-like protein 4 n=1 Tax=Panicum miliaceum TaxID=4540 RepID=A0A3L6Q0L2_PANMI|nr:phosphoglycerate mutase-like protein 4 [Panicum miliaceum]
MSPASSQGEHFAEVVVVRHGETSWNASRIIQGQMDPEPNETGRQQAAMLVFDQALRERHMGDLHGLKYDDAVRSKPEAYKAFSSDDRNQEIPGGGESLDQLSERCVSFLNAIAEKHKGERVIVVSHGATIEQICRHADPTCSVRRRIPNTSISVIHISGDNRHWILEKVGDVGHLNNEDSSFLQSAFGGNGASA